MEKRQIHIGTAEAIRTAYIDCLMEMTKNDIVDRLRDIRAGLAETEVEFVDGDGHKVTVPRSVSDVLCNLAKKNFYSAKKEDLATALAYFLSDPGNDKRVENKETGNIIRQLGIAVARTGVLDLDRVRSIAGEQAVTVKRSYWRDEVRISPKLRQFTAWVPPTRYDYYSRNKDIYLKLMPKACSEYIREAYPPEPDHLNALPEGEIRYLTVNRQKEVLNELSIIHLMNEAGTITPATTKLLTKNDIKAFRNQHADDPESEQVALFFGSPLWEPEVTLELLPLLAYMFMVEAELSPEGRGRKSRGWTFDAVDAVRVIANSSELYTYYPQIVKALLPGIEGLSQSTMRLMTIRTSSSSVMAALKKVPKECWCSVANIITEVYCSLYQTDDELMIDDSEYWPNLSRRKSSKEKEAITPLTALHNITFPFVRGLLFFLGSLGVVELAMDRDTEMPDTPFGALKYIRLTPLGLYVLGRGDKIEAEGGNRFAGRYELVDDPMFIVSLEAENPYNAWVDRIGDRRGSRWAVTPATVLRNCSSANDIQQIYSDFCRYVRAEPPTVWRNFFDRLINNAGENSMRRTKENFQIFNINPDNRELLHFLASDAEVRKLIIKAEGYRILVASNKLNSFRTAMRRGGFLV